MGGRDEGAVEGLPRMEFAFPGPLRDALVGADQLCYSGSIPSMKLSVSISVEDVELLDAYARASGLASRSAVVQHAINLLRVADLEEDYAAAWQEWEASGERAAWESTSGDDLTRQAG